MTILDKQVYSVLMLIERDLFHKFYSVLHDRFRHEWPETIAQQHEGRLSPDVWLAKDEKFGFKVSGYFRGNGGERGWKYFYNIHLSFENNPKKESYKIDNMTLFKALVYIGIGKGMKFISSKYIELELDFHIVHTQNEWSSAYIPTKLFEMIDLFREQFFPVSAKQSPVPFASNIQANENHDSIVELRPETFSQEKGIERNFYLKFYEVLYDFFVLNEYKTRGSKIPFHNYGSPRMWNLQDTSSDQQFVVSILFEKNSNHTSPHYFYTIYRQLFNSIETQYIPINTMILFKSLIYIGIGRELGLEFIPLDVKDKWTQAFNLASLKTMITLFSQKYI